MIVIEKAVRLILSTFYGISLQHFYVIYYHHDLKSPFTSMMTCTSELIQNETLCRTLNFGHFADLKALTYFKSLSDPDPSFVSS